MWWWGRPDSKGPQRLRKMSFRWQLGHFSGCFGTFLLHQDVGFSPHWLGAVCGQRCRIDADAQTLVTWSKGMWSRGSKGNGWRCCQFEGNFVHVNLAHVNGSKLWLLGTASQLHCEKTEPEKVSTFSGDFRRKPWEGPLLVVCLQIYAYDIFQSNIVTRSTASNHTVLRPYTHIHLDIYIYM